MNATEMTQRIIEMARCGLLDNLVVQFVWGTSRRTYKLSNFRFENGDVCFRQDTSTGDDAYPNNSLANINDWFMRDLLAALNRAVVLDRNLLVYEGSPCGAQQSCSFRPKPVLDMSVDDMLERIGELVMCGVTESYEFIDKFDNEVVTIHDIWLGGNGKLYVTYSTFPSGEVGEFSLQDCDDDYLSQVYDAIFGEKRDKNLF